mgnify:FL=1
MHVYKVKYAQEKPEYMGLWDGHAWKNVEHINVDAFRPESSEHRPETSVKLLYDEHKIYGIFRVVDRYIHCTRTRYQDPVCKDSCVEFFVQPKPPPVEPSKKLSGYFNFEFNCGGTLYCSYITDPEIVNRNFKEVVMLPPEDGTAVRIFHSMPEVVDPEIAETAEWFLEFSVPLSLLEKYAGHIGSPKGQKWRANFYKCASDTTHPHWAAWSPVDKLNFHLPHCFGTIIFE